MHSWSILTDIGVLLLVSLFCGAIAVRLKLSPIIGYLLAGILVGALSDYKLIESSNEIELISELGVSLLLFSLGLEFSWKKLKTFSYQAILGAALQVLLTPLIIFAIGLLFALPMKLIVVIAIIVTLSSTAIVLRTLVDNGEFDSIQGRLATVTLLLQDIAIVPFTIIITLLASPQAVDSSNHLLTSFLSLSALVLGLYLILNKILAPVFKVFTLERNREMSILLAVVIGIGSAWLAHKINISPALGAFIAGMMLGSSPFSIQIKADVSPLKVIFLTLFFGSVGLVADLQWIAQNIFLVLGLTVAVIVLKTIVCSLIFRAAGKPSVVSLAAAISLAQIGEFAFVLSKLAKDLSLIEDHQYQVIFSVAILSMLISTLMIKHAPFLAQYFRRLVRGNVSVNFAVEKKDLEEKYFVLGFGPAGQEVALQLADAGYKNIHIIDLNNSSIKDASTCYAAHIGDVRQAEVLIHNDIVHAKIIIITVPNLEASMQTIHHCKQLAPEATIIARARYQSYQEVLEKAGADIVINEEASVGKDLGEIALKSLEFEEN